MLIFRTMVIAQNRALEISSMRVGDRTESVKNVESKTKERNTEEHKHL